MNDLRKYITILETAGNDELQKYRDEQKYWQNEHKKYWPVSPELLAQYKDGSHTMQNKYGLYWENKNGEWHRDGDKPAILDALGYLAWLQNGKLHRDGDNPAKIWPDGTLEWWQNDKRHRFRGPAIIRADGRLEWVIYDENITQEVNEWLGSEEWQGTPEQIVEFQLRFI